MNEFSNLMKYLLLLFPALLFSQSFKIHGTILDDSTKQTLSYAIIRVAQSEIVTSSNKEGKFILEFAQGNYSLLISYVGYHSTSFSITIPTDTLIKIGLVPAVIQMPEVTVNSNAEDPAMEIMREAIKRREKNYEGLKNYEVTGYRKNILYSGGRIAMIDEQFVRQIYETKGLSKDFILSTHKSENIKKVSIPISMNIGASLFFVRSKFTIGIQNSSSSTVFPLADNAFQYYDFKLLNTKIAGKEITHTIQVIPKSSVTPLMKGKIVIDDATYSLIGANVETNEGWDMPIIKDFYMKILQSYTNYNGFWIPQYSEVEMGGKISALGGLLNLDKMKISEVFSASTCKVNGTVPDSIQKARRSKYGGFTTDTAKAVNKLQRKIKSKQAPNPQFQLFEPAVAPVEISKEIIDSIRPLPLTTSEKIAFAELDSSQTLSKLMKPKGALSLISSSDTNRSIWMKGIIGVAKHGILHNNRVEGITPGVWFDEDEMDSQFFYNGELAYATGAKFIEWKIGGGYNLGEDHLDRIDVNVWKTIQSWQPSRFIPKSINSTFFFSNGEDFHNYMHSTGFNIGIHKYFTDSLFAKIYFSSEDEQSINGNSNVALKKRIQPPNPFINEGKNNVLRLQFGFEPISPISFLIQTKTRLVVDAEFSLPSLGSKFDYQRYVISGQTRLSTIYSTMFNAPYLFLSVEGGYIAGTIGIQHLITPSASYSSIAPVGVLKGVQYYDLVGNKFISFQAEHNWQTLLFVFLGMNGVKESGLQIITGGSFANIWNYSSYGIPQKSWKPYWETYLGVGNILDLFRVDIVHTADKQNLIRLSVSSALMN